MSVGSSSACSVIPNGSSGYVECWGNDNVGQLGDGQTVNPTTVAGRMINSISTAKSVSVGTDRACAVMNDGTVQCWGSWASQTMVGGSMANSSVPVAVPSITTATAVSVGGGTDCTILGDGSIYCWNRLGSANVYSF